MNSWPSAILFDFDGVIVNSEPLHLLAFQEVLKSERIDLGREEYYEQLIGFDDRGAFLHLYKSRQLPLEPGKLLRLLTRKSEMTMELIRDRQYQALEGVEEFVRGVWRHYPLAIVSGARRDEIEAMLEGVRLRDCFPTIVAADDVSVGKPDPSGYLLAVELMSQRTRTKLKPSDCLVIEDAPSVVKSTRQVGFHVLGVTTSHRAEELADAHYVLSTLRPQEVRKKIPQLKTDV